MKEHSIVGLSAVAVVLTLIAVALMQFVPASRASAITDFEGCAAAGYPVMESYPRQCAVPGGDVFVENIDPIDERPSCVVAGCSAQLCVEESEAEFIVTTCEYRAEYACYQSQSRCERQSTGMCDWTPTEELRACLKDPLETKLDASLQVI